MVFEMPKLGMDMEEGTVLTWYKKENDTVKKGEPFAEIETDKAAVQVEAPCDGVVLKYYHPEGETLPISTPLAVIGEAGEAVPALEELNSQAKESAKEDNKSKETVITGNGDNRISINEKGKVRISPRARKLAEKNGIDYSVIAPSSRSGRIMEKDVREYMAAKAEDNEPKAAPSKEYEMIPLTTMRKTIARRMTESATTIPTFTLEVRVDMRRIIELRSKLKARNTKVSFHDVIAKCACCAAKLHPWINASYTDEGIRQYLRTNVGIAVSVDGGLVVPVVRDIDDLRVAEIAAVSTAIITKARDGKLDPDDMSGGHFTISNLGMYPLNSFTAIINPPESCILACAGLVNIPAVENGQLIEIPTMSITATFDHRLIDGAYGAEFMKTFKEYMEDPAMIIM